MGKISRHTHTNFYIVKTFNQQLSTKKILHLQKNINNNTLIRYQSNIIKKICDKVKKIVKSTPRYQYGKDERSSGLNLLTRRATRPH